MFFKTDLEFEAKVGSATVNQEPFLQLRTSRDWGKTYGPPKARSLGKTGEYDTRVNYRSLGQFRQMTVEISWSTPLDITVGATAILEAS